MKSTIEILHAEYCCIRNFLEEVMSSSPALGYCIEEIPWLGNQKITLMAKKNGLTFLNVDGSTPPQEIFIPYELLGKILT